MKNSILILLTATGFYVPCKIYAQQTRQVQKQTTIISPDKKITATVLLDAKQNLVYTIQYAGKKLLQNSALGIIREDADFSTGLQWLSSSEQSVVRDNYNMLTAKRSSINYVASKRIITVKNKSGDAMQVIFQVSNDGVAFRYVFPQMSSAIKKITTEATSFHFYEGGTLMFHIHLTVTDARLSYIVRSIQPGL